MKAFNEENIRELSAEMRGREVDEIRLRDDGADSYLEIALSDGRILRFRYDWIYEFEIK